MFCRKLFVLNFGYLSFEFVYNFCQKKHEYQNEDTKTVTNS